MIEGRGGGGGNNSSKYYSDGYIGAGLQTPMNESCKQVAYKQVGECHAQPRVLQNKGICQNPQ